MQTIKQKQKDRWRNSHLIVHVMTDPRQYFSTHISDRNHALMIQSYTIFFLRVSAKLKVKCTSNSSISLASRSHQVAHDFSRCFCFWLQDNLMNQVFLSFLFILQGANAFTSKFFAILWKSILHVSPNVSSTVIWWNL